MLFFFLFSKNYLFLFFLFKKKSSKPSPSASRKPAKKGMQLKAKSTESSEYLKALQDIGELGDESDVLDAYEDETAVVETIQKKGYILDICLK